MRDVFVGPITMTRFDKYPDQSLKEIAGRALDALASERGPWEEFVEAAFCANSVAGLVTGQETIRGQVVLRSQGIGGLPVYNVENACASSSTAFHLARLTVGSGQHDCVLVLGFEKMTHEDRSVTFRAYESGLDVEEHRSRSGEDGAAASQDRSVFMDLYAKWARNFMERTGAEPRHLARVASKNHLHGSMNPHAQYQKEMSVEEVLADKPVVEPLTRSMCSPISDGASAALVCSESSPALGEREPVRVASTEVLSPEVRDRGSDPLIGETTSSALDAADCSLEDVDLFEIHDATASAELVAYDEMGLCEPGEAHHLVEEGRTRYDGDRPVNTSGGLESKGHPVGATGLGQITELVWQLRGEAGDRQVEPRPGRALAENAGGVLGDGNAACAVTILER